MCSDEKNTAFDQLGKDWNLSLQESESPESKPMDNLREYEQLDRFENFYEHYEAHDDEQSSNNGKKNLTFVGECFLQIPHHLNPFQIAGENMNSTKITHL